MSLVFQQQLIISAVAILTSLAIGPADAFPYIVCEGGIVGKCITCVSDPFPFLTNESTTWPKCITNTIGYAGSTNDTMVCRDGMLRDCVQCTADPFPALLNRHKTLPLCVNILLD
jgi:hypothetical protein